MASAGAALNYPYRPIHKQQQQQHSQSPSSPPPLPRGTHAMHRATSYESIVQKQPPRPPVTQPFHALTREEMGWETLKDPQTLRPKALKTKAPKPSFKLNKTQKREFGWNTSFPAEYGLVSLASDFKATLSYTQHKLKELHQHKQLLRASASSSQISDADVLRNHDDSTLNHLQHAFNCHQPQPLSDPQDEIRIMKAILIREGLVTRLKGTMQKIRIGDHSSLQQAPDGSSVLTLLLQTRQASLAVIEAIVRWYQTLAVPRPYIWNGQSYVHRMLDDLNFLGDVDVMAEALGVAPRSMVRNPFMMPTSIADRDLESFRYMLSPPAVKLPPTKLPTIPATDSMPAPAASQPSVAVAEADAFLIWCCIHLEESPSASSGSGAHASSNQSVAPTTVASTHQHVLEWQARAEMQLKLLSMPMESSTGVHVMDSSPLMKRKGHLPSLSAAPPETLKELIHHVHDPNSGQPPKHTGSRLPVAAAVTTNAKYANVKPRVTADPKPHHMKHPPKPAAPMKPTKRLHSKQSSKPKAPQPTVLTVQDMSVSNAELEALSAIETPPQVVALIAATILILLTPGDLVPKDVSWATSRTILSNGRDLLRTLHAMSTGPPVADFKLRALKPFLANERFRPAHLLSISKPAAVLCAWVLEMVNPASTGCTLYDPAMVDQRDRSDLLSYLEDDSDMHSQPQAASSDPDVLVVHESSDANEARILYSGAWTYRGLTYTVTFFLGPAAPTTLHLKLYEPQSSTETQATMTCDEIQHLFGDTATQYVQARAWIELCQLILSKLDHVMAPLENQGHAAATSLDDEHELWDALSTPRAPAPRVPTPEEMHGAAVRIQCATRQKQSRQRVRTLRASQKAKQHRQKAPTLFMTGKELRALETQADSPPKQPSPTHAPKQQRSKSTHAQAYHHHRSLVEMQGNYVVDIESEWKEIEAHAVHGIKSASRRRLSNVQVHDLEKLLHSAASANSLKPALPKRQDDAALRIQCAARQRLARRKVDRTRRGKQQNEAAVHIQCLARQKFARDKVNRIKQGAKHRAVAMTPQDDAAVRIQCMSRQRKASQLVQQRREDREQRRAQRRQQVDPEYAAVRIQCMARTRHAKRVVHERRQNARKSPAQSDRAAVTIQCMARRHTATKVVQERRVSKQRASSIQYDNAALHIQCMTRQKLARKKVESRRQQAQGRVVTSAPANDYDDEFEDLDEDGVDESPSTPLGKPNLEPASPKLELPAVDLESGVACSIEPGAVASETSETNASGSSAVTKASPQGEPPTTVPDAVAGQTNAAEPSIAMECDVLPLTADDESPIAQVAAPDSHEAFIASQHAMGVDENSTTDAKSHGIEATHIEALASSDVQVPSPMDGRPQELTRVANELEHGTSPALISEPTPTMPIQVGLDGSVVEDEDFLAGEDKSHREARVEDQSTAAAEPDFALEEDGFESEESIQVVSAEATLASSVLPTADAPTSSSRPPSPDSPAQTSAATSEARSQLCEDTSLILAVATAQATEADTPLDDIPREKGMAGDVSKSCSIEVVPAMGASETELIEEPPALVKDLAGSDVDDTAPSGVAADVGSENKRNEERNAESHGQAAEQLVSTEDVAVVESRRPPPEAAVAPPLDTIFPVPPVSLDTVTSDVVAPSSDAEPTSPSLPTYDNEFDDGFALGSGRSSDPVDPAPEAATELQSQINATRPETSAMYFDDEFEDE